MRVALLSRSYRCLCLYATLVRLLPTRQRRPDRLRIISRSHSTQLTTGTVRSISCALLFGRVNNNVDAAAHRRQHEPRDKQVGRLIERHSALLALCWSRRNEMKEKSAARETASGAH